ncbi:MAG TPA: acetate--CoA ligase family protein [Candidatus Blautia intestinigallinarum]|nr:acetate--CoA ligase family protein [Candidatus Cottocaccamicrobium excrementipullorum]HIV35127.1 acetate--CoA ligase family protein [Candidatus Blautia intestinigallinarum]
MDIQKLIKPKSIAVVGVTDKPGFGRGAAQGALNSRIVEHAYFVHPKKTELFGKKCYPNISSLPEVPECVVLATNCHTIPGLLEEAGAFGVKAAVIYASGFSEENTEEGIALEEQVKEIARKYDMCICGPNCMGMLNNVDKINLWGGHTHWDLEDDAHGIAIIAQSGFICAEILNTDFFNISYEISSGNGNIVTLEEFLEFVVEDEHVSVVALYLEGVRDSARFLSALKKAAQMRKPVVILKSGRSVRGAISAASHTGSMAGSNKSYMSIFEKYGVIVAETLEEFMCLAQTLSVLNGNFPTKKEVAVISFSGGESTLSADIAEEVGVELAEISQETKDKLKQYIPAYASAKNPLDATTTLFHEDEKTVGVLKSFNDDPAVGLITVGVNVKKDDDLTTSDMCKSIAHAKELGVTKPVVAIPSLEGYRYRGSRRILEDAGVPLMSSMGTSFTALKKLLDFADYDYKEHNLESCVPKDHEGAESYALSEYDSKEEMKQYGVPVPAQAIARSVDEIREAVKGMKYPLALKINSSEILHKTEAGGVKLHIQNEEEAAAAYNEIMENVARTSPGKKTDGILVQEMAPSGVEIIIGVTNDKQFGPMLLVGLGGIYVEVFKDAALYPVPLNKGEAMNMLKSLKSYKLLTGYRGSKPCDLDALTDMMVKISDYAYAHKDEIKEMDLNPVFVYPQGEGVCAVDALIVKYK